MNLLDFDRKIREITPNEIHYRKGYLNTSINDFKSRKIGDDTVLYISLKELMKDDYKLVVSKKHSRFQSFPLHCHDGLELNYMYSGSCNQIINGNTYSLIKGQALLLDSDTVHTIEPLGTDDILFNINIDKDYLTSNFFNRFSSNSILTRFFWDSITNGVKHDNYLLFNSENSERLHIFISELLIESLNPTLSSVDIQDSLLTLIFSELVTIYQDDYVNKHNQSNKRLLVPILKYIEQNYLNCTLRSTANEFSLNPNYLSNMLKKHTGYSYQELIQQQKLKLAHQLLLNTDLSITIIASKCGYENVSFFYTKFKQEYDCLPGEYRKNFKL